MRKLILTGCLIFSMAICAGCGAKKSTDDTSKTTTEAAKEDKVLSKYKVPEIIGAKKTDQLAEATGGETIATMKVKGFGEIKLKFFLKEAPLAVKNFVTLAANGYYDGQTFHRTINEFMIQGGDPTGTGTGGESIWGKEFKNENSDQLLPLRGALCMANSGADTNGSQFFIVQAKADTAKQILESDSSGFTEEEITAFEDQGGYPSLTGGYTVFGQMVEGYDVLDEIAAVETEGEENSTPVKDVVIEKIIIGNAE